MLFHQQQGQAHHRLLIPECVRAILTNIITCISQMNKVQFRELKNLDELPVIRPLLKAGPRSFAMS